MPRRSSPLSVVCADCSVEFEAWTVNRACCDECRKRRNAAKSLAWYHNNIEKARRPGRQVRHNPGVARRSALKTRYGVTQEDYERMLEAQGGTCRLCHATPDAQRYGRLSIDHDHVTGRVRDLLCGRCNFMLGQSGDDPQRLLGGALYLEGHRQSQLLH